jgi:subtilisin family serine protease
VRLIAVRVLDCNGSGTNAQVISGIEWAIGNHAAGQAAVANMSLGGSANSAIDTAIRSLSNDGVTVVVAAGNDTADACSYSPSRVAEAITVAASDINDAMASFSNGGTCVDIFGPGVNVLSAWNTDDTATNTISGTSMASPHVAGVAALYLATNPTASPSAVTTAIINNSTPNKVTSAGTGSPNRLLYSLFGGGGGGSSQLLSNPGFESGAVSWSATSGVITSSTSRTPRTGSWYAWLDGYGSTHTDTLSQAVSIPAGKTSATLTFYLKIDTAETTTTVAYDKLTVQVLNSAGSVLKTCATYSNLNSGTTYSQKSCSLTAYIGQTVTVKFTGTEDASLQTSFLIDDTALTVL